MVCDIIYLISGKIDEIITTSCEIYNAKSRTWKKMTSCNEATSDPGICFTSTEFIYKFGGENASGKLSRIIEKYDT